MSQPKHNHIANSVSGYTPRYTDFEGKPHIIVPVVILTEGVHQGSGGRMLYTAEELQKFPASWNGIPVPVYHPMDANNSPLSCNSPELIEQQTVGRMFNTVYANGKLSSELWVDIQKLNQLDPEALKRLKAGEPMEVSTGLWSEDEQVQGIWHNEQYDGIVRNMRPDHLALLPNQTGACSLADGCGIRANMAKEGYIMFLNGVATMPEGVRKYGNVKFADPKNKKYPIDTEAHIRAAWNYINMPRNAGMYSASECAKIKNKIVAAWKAKIDPSGPPSANVELKGMAAMIFNEMSYQDVQRAIQEVADGWDVRTPDGPVKLNYVVAVFPDYFIYREENFAQGGGDSCLYKKNYTVAEDGSITVSQEVKQVKQEVLYTEMPMTANKEKEETQTMETGKEKKSCCPDRVNALIKANAFPEADREMLEGMSAEQLGRVEALHANALKAAEKKEEAPAKKEEVKANKEEVKKDENKAPTFEELLANADDTTKEAIQVGTALAKERREVLTASIMGFKGNKWTAEELKGKSIEELGKIEAMIPQDYSGRGPAGGGTPVINAGDKIEVLEAPTMEFKKPDQK